MPTQGRVRETKRNVRAARAGARRKQALTRLTKHARIADGRAQARRRAAAAKR